MGTIFKGQTKLQIKLTVEQDITGAVQTLIRYKKPSGARGEWTANIVNPATGILDFEPASAATLDETGQWTLWAFVQFSDGRTAAGEPVTMQVNGEGR